MFIELLLVNTIGFIFINSTYIIIINYTHKNLVIFLLDYYCSSKIKKDKLYCNIITNKFNEKAVSSFYL